MKKVFVAGHRGLAGSAICRELSKSGAEIITCPKKSLDLRNQQEVFTFFKNNKIDEVYLAAGKVGGIYANNAYPAEFVYENLMIEANVIHAAHLNDVQKLLFLGSSCIYPKFAEQPIKESELLNGSLEETNEPYAIAKIAGIKLCESYNRQYGRDYRSVMPTNLYGPNDNFHMENAHVIPALLRRFHNAVLNNESVVEAWGSGRPKREFLYVDDLAAACVYIMNLDITHFETLISPMQSHINVGAGDDCSIRELVETIAKITGFSGNILWDSTKPDGTPRKLLDISILRKLGWTHSYSLSDGLHETYQWFLKNQSDLRT